MPHQTSIDIPSNTRKSVIELLNGRLADLTDLKLAVKHAHWNVKGPSFIGLHKMFDEFSAELDTHIDAVAERVTALGGTAHGTLAQTVKGTTQPTFPAELFDGMKLVRAVADGYAAAGKKVRDGIDEADEAGDAGTADLLTDVSRVLDERLWFLEAHLQA